MLATEIQVGERYAVRLFQVELTIRVLRHSVEIDNAWRCETEAGRQVIVESTEFLSKADSTEAKNRRILPSVP